MSDKDFSGSIGVDTYVRIGYAPGRTLISSDNTGNLLVNKSPVGATATINVQAAGATGDGSTDDTSAISAAISSLSVYGGTVAFPTGTYQVSSTISVPSNVRLVGAGKNSSAIRKSQNIATAMLDFTGASNASRCQRGGMADLRIDGSGFTGPLMRCKWADHLNFDRLWFYNNLDQGSYLENCWDTYFNNCEWDTVSGSDGLKPSVLISSNSDDSSNSIFFHGCRWENFLDGSLWISSRPPVVARTPVTGTNPPHSIWITNFKMESVQIAGLMLLSSSDVSDVHHAKGYVAATGLGGGQTTGRTLFSIIGAADWSFEDIHVFANGSGNTTVDNVFTIFTNAEIKIRDVLVDASQALGTSIVKWSGGTPDVYTENVRFKKGQSGTVYGGSSGDVTYPVLPSAATITPWLGPRTYQVSGTTGITAVSALRAGYVIELVFAGSLTVTNGSTLKLAGAANFSATADDVLTLISDGTNWREVSRSVN